MNQINPLAFQSTPAFDTVDTETLLVRQYASGPNGPLSLSANPINPLDAVTKQYLDSALGGFADRPAISPSPPISPSPSDLWWDSVGGNLYIRYDDGNSAQWVIAVNAGVPEAPMDGLAYARQNFSWVPVLPLTGGTITGPLYLTGPFTNANQAVSKAYVDGLLDSEFLRLTGGVLTGFLTLMSDPVLALHAATKQYVDQYRFSSLIDEAPPANPRDGMLWWDTKSAQLYVYNAGSWVMANTPNFGCVGGPPGPGGQGGGNNFFGTIPPSSPNLGDLWIVPGGGMFVWNGNTWIGISGEGVVGGAQVTVADSPPPNPSPGDLWWDDREGQLYIRYNSGITSQWVAAAKAFAGGGAEIDPVWLMLRSQINVTTP